MNRNPRIAQAGFSTISSSVDRRNPRELTSSLNYSRARPISRESEGDTPNSRLGYRVGKEIVRTNDRLSRESSYTNVSESSRGCTGLRNLGNTCFMNSILQILIHTPYLHEYFLEGKNIRSEKNSDSKLRGELATAFHEFIVEYRRSPKHSSVSPYDIKYYTERIAPQFRGYSQHDSAEFLRAILDGLHRDLNRVRGKPVYREMTGSAENIARTADQWWNYSLERDNSIITDVFQGQLLSCITCSSCRSRTLSCDTFLDIALTIARHSYSRATLNDSFESFSKASQVPSYKCEKCKKTGNCTQEVSFYRFPRVLVIQLKRFSVNGYRREKLNTDIDIPETLHLGRFAPLSRDPSVDKARYRLFGSSHHLGSLGFGHYIAECIDGGQWYCFDDSRVSNAYHSGHSDSAYVLFYYRDD